MLYVIIGHDAPDATDKRPAVRPAHLEHLAPLSGAGRIKLAGKLLDRVDTLRPDVALFLVDTQLRMRDKLVPMFAAEAVRRGLGWEVRRLEREIWRVGPEIYLLNSDPDIVRNLGACLAAHFRGRGIAVRPLSAPSSE